MCQGVLKSVRITVMNSLYLLSSDTNRALWEVVLGA